MIRDDGTTPQASQKTKVSRKQVSGAISPWPPHSKRSMRHATPSDIRPPRQLALLIEREDPITMAALLLSEAAIAALQTELPQWHVVNGKLHRELRFKDFSEAFGFMARVALAAEQLGHHPEWRNVWNRVDIDLITHDSGGLSDLDVLLARHIDAIVAGS